MDGPVLNPVQQTAYSSRSGSASNWPTDLLGMRSKLYPREQMVLLYVARSYVFPNGLRSSLSGTVFPYLEVMSHGLAYLCGEA